MLCKFWRCERFISQLRKFRRCSISCLRITSETFIAKHESKRSIKHFIGEACSGSAHRLRPSASPLYTEPCCASRDVITSNSHFHSAQFKGFSNLVASEAIKSNRRFISPSIECLEKSIFKQIPRRDKNLCLAISVEKLFLRIRKLKISSWIILKWIHLSRKIFMRFLRKLMKKKTQVSSTTSRFLKISSQRT